MPVDDESAMGVRRERNGREDKRTEVKKRRSGEVEQRKVLQAPLNLRSPSYYSTKGSVDSVLIDERNPSIH